MGGALWSISCFCAVLWDLREWCVGPAVYSVVVLLSGLSEACIGGKQTLNLLLCVKLWVCVIIVSDLALLTCKLHAMGVLDAYGVFLLGRVSGTIDHSWWV
jgi:hypothetical protein